MRVIAINKGFYAGSTVRPGVEFDMCELDEDHKPAPIRMPRWVRPTSDGPQRKVKTEEQETVDAAIATAGPKRPGVRAVTNLDGTDLF